MTTNEFQPYVGPRPFERKEEDSVRFFGRSQETQEIASLIFGHPITLVYAQSGAGKTSLFNTSVVLQLEEKGFDVLPLARVGGVLPKGIAHRELKNLYVFNALLKMDPESDPQTLLSKSLPQFLETLQRTTNKRGQPCPRAIIFDQFEELFTYTPENWREQRDAFFLQVVEAVNFDPLLRIVFVIREDFLAELDPFAQMLPEHLRIRYRLERLGENAALRAIKDPLVNTPRKFAPDVAEGLVKELLAVKAVDATGKTAEIEGEYVEPVQLQVVCVTLWSTLKPEVTEIQKTHLENFNVNDALSNFYKSAVESAAEETGVPEADLRNWFGKILITPMDTRSTVFRGEVTTGGIDNRAVDFLESRHIIRAEFRAGARWYELTHDRLVEPIRKSNEAWFEKNSSLLQNQTALWVAHERPEGMLLRGKELEQAELELEKRLSESKTITKDENDFLDACRRARKREQHEKRTNLLIRAFAIMALILFGIAAAFAYKANVEKNNAEAAGATATYALGSANEARTKEASAGWNSKAVALAGQAQIALNSNSSDSSDDSRGELLAVEAYKANEQAEQDTLPSVYQALIDSVLKRNFTKIKDQSFLAASFSTDGDWLMVDDILWNLLNNQRSYLDIGSGKVILSAFASEEEAVFITENPNYYSFYGLEQDRFTLHIFNVNNPGNIQSVPLAVPVDAYATDVDLSNDGHWVAVAYSYLQGDNRSGGVNVWNIQDPSFQRMELAAYYVDGSDQKNPEVTNVALSADGTKLAAFDSANGFLNFWEYSATKQDFDRINPKNNPQKVGDINFTSGKFSGKSGRGLQYSPDGKWLVALTDASKINIYNAEKQAYFTAITLEKENLVGLLFSPDNKYLIGVTNSSSYCNDHPSQNCQPGAALKRWKLGIENPAPDVVFQSTTKDITALHVGNDGTIAIGDEAGYVRAWSPGDELKLIEDTYVHNRSVNGILVGGQDGKTIVSASEDDATLLWKLLQENVVVAVVIKRISNTSTSVVQNTTGKELAIGGSSPKSASGLVSLYSELQNLQDPNKLGEPISFTSGRGSLEEVALGNTWIAAGRICDIGSKNYYLDIWSRDKSASPISLQLDSEIGSLSFSPDEKYLAVAYNSGKLQILETAGFKGLPANPASANAESCAGGSPLSSLPQSALRELPNDLTNMKSLVFAQNGNYNYLVGASQQGARIWSMDSFTIEADLYNASYPVRISLNQKWLATGSSENAIQGSFTNAIQLYDLSNIHSSPAILPVATTITELAFSEDGQWLAAATKSREIMIFNLLPMPQTIPSFTLTGFTKDITWLEFSPITSKVQWLAVSSGSKVFLYNMKNAAGTPLSLAHASTATVDYVGFAKEGEWVISAATDQTLWFWSLDPKTLSDTACAYAGRNLNPSERKRYSTGDQTCTNYEVLEPVEVKLDITPNPYPTAGVQLTPTFPPQTATLSTLPTPTEEVITYTVKEGDTLTSIASKYGIDLKTLATDNGITDPNQIRIGQTLQIKTHNTPVAP